MFGLLHDALEEARLNFRLLDWWDLAVSSKEHQISAAVDTHLRTVVPEGALMTKLRHDSTYILCNRDKEACGSICLGCYAMVSRGNLLESVGREGLSQRCKRADLRKRSRENPGTIRSGDFLPFAKTIICERHHLQIAILHPLFIERNTMPVFVLAARGADLGTLSGPFTPEDKEYLSIFLQIFRVDITSPNVQVVITTKSHIVEDWELTGTRVVDLAQRYVKTLIRNRKVGLVAEGAASYVSPQSDLLPRGRLARAYYASGYHAADPARGRQDVIAHVFMLQQGLFMLCPSRGRPFHPTIRLSTFEVQLPARFAPLCALARELMALCKVVVTGLGDKQEPGKLVIATTLADWEKWPVTTATAVSLARNFIMDQISHRLVTLEFRPEGSYLGISFSLQGGGGEDYTNSTAGLRGGAQSDSLPETFADLIDCLFDTFVDNHIVDIARTSMELAGNRPLPPPSAGQLGSPIAASGIPAQDSGPAGLDTASPNSSHDQHLGWGSGEAQESDAGGDGSFHTAPESVAMSAGVDIEIPFRIRPRPMRMFPLRIPSFVALTHVPRPRCRRERLVAYPQLSYYVCRRRRGSSTGR